MDILLQQILDNWYKLFEVFGWWSVLLVLAVFLVMLPINFLFIKLFAIGGTNDVKERLRKFISSLTVFVVAGVALTIFYLVNKDAVQSHQLNFDFVFHNAIPLAVLAMLFRSLYKMIRDVGFKPVMEVIAQSETLKKEIGKFVSDPKIIDVVLDFLKLNKKSIENSEIDEQAKTKVELILELERKLRGLVERPEELSQSILDFLFQKNQKEVS